MSQRQTSGGGLKDGNNDANYSTRPPKEKRKRTKKAKDPTAEEDLAATATKDAKAPATIAPNGSKKPSAPQYCFRCGKSDHTVKGCREPGDLKCENHPETTSHKKRSL